MARLSPDITRLLEWPGPPAPVNVGDVVRLQGGWCHMLVVDLDPYQPIAVCSWRTASGVPPCEATFEIAILELIEPSKERR